MMLIRFWNAQRPILEQYHELGTTVKSISYNEMLRGQRKPSIARQCPSTPLKASASWIWLLFDPHKDALKCCHFAIDQEMKEPARSRLTVQPQTFFYEGIQKLVNSWTKCIEKGGCYIKKMMVLFALIAIALSDEN
jgi:hypothetical protein